jgi:hypothetical protein
MCVCVCVCGCQCSHKCRLMPDAWCLNSFQTESSCTTGQRGLTRASVQITTNATLFGTCLCVYCFKFKRNETRSDRPTTLVLLRVRIAWLKKSYGFDTGFILHLYTPLETKFGDYWHTQTSVLSLLVSTISFLAAHSTQWRFVSFPRSGRLVIAALAEILPKDKPTGSQAGGNFTPTSCSIQLATDNRTLSLTNQHLHSTELLATDNFYWKHQTTTTPCFKLSCL